MKRKPEQLYDSPIGPIPFPRHRRDLARLLLVVEAEAPKLGIPFDAEKVFRRQIELEASIRRADTRRFWRAFAVVFSLMAGIGVIVLRTWSAGFVAWRLGGGLSGCAIFAAALGYVYILTLGGFPSDDDGSDLGRGHKPGTVSPDSGAGEPQPVPPVQH